MGLDLQQFEGNVEDKFICAICQKVFLNPQRNSCGHVFCASCIGRRLTSATNRKCPICQDPLQAQLEAPDKDLCLQLLNLRIHCSNKCGHVVPLGQLPDHASEACPLAAVNCPYLKRGCRKRVRRCDVTAHSMECDYRQVACEACGHVTVYCELFTHQKKTKCLERKLKQQVIREMRNNQREVKRHRAQLSSLSTRLQIQQQKISTEHARYLQQKNSPHVTLHRLQGPTETANGNVFMTQATDDGQEPSDDTPSPAPHPSRAGHAVFSCMRCNKLFNTLTNDSRSCRWHAGPIMEVFGGTCSACGKVDYLPGCVMGPHQS